MSLPEWSYRHGKPQQTARFKQQPADFVVIEDMGFEPDGMSQEQMKEMTVAFNLPK